MRRQLYFYTLIEVPFPEASALLRHDPGRWLPGARPAPDPGAAPDPGGAPSGAWMVPLRADGALPGPLDTAEAVVSVGAAVTHGSQVLRPVAWRAAAAAALFPKLEGELVLDALGGSGCHLSLMGSYRPPLSVVGGAADAMYGHRVAEACVRRFVLDVADRLVAVDERS